LHPENIKIYIPAMKKIFFTLLFILFLVFSINAQDYKTSLGIRVGYPYGISIKHFLNEKNAVEGILAIRDGGFVATALYENEHWTGQYPGLNWYWGLGAHVGFWDPGANRFINKANFAGEGVIGVDAILGLEYTFDEIPLNLSADVFPCVNLINTTGWGGLNWGISARYVF
jgi:hypothetical protein